MLFAKNNKTENNSAKKKARREKTIAFPVVLLLCVLIAAAAAAGAFYLYHPQMYSDVEIDSYVRSIYGDSWTLQKKNVTADERGDVASYLYAGGESGSFTVFSTSVPVLKDGVPTGRYKRAIYDNYFSTVIENHMEELEELARKAKKAGPELVIENEGQTRGANGSQYTFRLYLEDFSMLEEAADLLEKTDNLLSFSCGAGEEPYAQLRAETPCVHVYIKPNRSGAAADAVSAAAGREPASYIIPEDWRSRTVRAEYETGRIPLTDRTFSHRIRSGDVLGRLENDYVDAAKTSGRQYYAISEELWEKYPAPVLTLVTIGGYSLPGVDGTQDMQDTVQAAQDTVPAARDTAQAQDTVQAAQEPQAVQDVQDDTPSYTYQFIYHRRTGTYWLTGLDPCVNFDGNPFGDYPGRGAFANLVRCLGGTCSEGKWSAEWRIGQTGWTASLQTQKTVRSPYTFKDLRVTRDGNSMDLDPVPAVFEESGTVPAQRPFSVRDLIRMLDVRITINQKEMTAVMFRDFKNVRSSGPGVSMTRQNARLFTCESVNGGHSHKNE